MKIIALLAALVAVPVVAQEPQVCIAQRQASALLRGVIEMSATINQQRAEIDALRRKLTEHGIDPTPELWTILQQLEAERNRQQGAQ